MGMDNRPLCTILRGAPGSGKTTWAQANRQTSTLCSADHYFTGADGIYRFDASKLGLAHAACRQRFKDALALGDNVLADNTHSRLWEFSHYVADALRAGYRVEIIHLTGRFSNIHGVPAAKVGSIRNRMEPLPEKWAYLQRDP